VVNYEATRHVDVEAEGIIPAVVVAMCGSGLL
jgi:hypothetical protein